MALTTAGGLTVQVRIVSRQVHHMEYMVDMIIIGVQIRFGRKGTVYELIKSSLQAYAFAAVFSGLWISLVVYGMFKKTKKSKTKR